MTEKEKELVATIQLALIKAIIEIDKEKLLELVKKNSFEVRDEIRTN